MSAPVTPEQLAEWRLLSKTVLFISDGTGGSEKVDRLLKAVPALLDEVERLDQIIASSGAPVRGRREAVARLVASQNAEARAEVARQVEVIARVRELAEQWRYKGEFGWGAWQEGEGPDPEGQVLDEAAARLRRALDGDQGGGGRG